jgi:hypothetical protein
LWMNRFKPSCLSRLVEGYSGGKWRRSKGEAQAAVDLVNTVDFGQQVVAFELGGAGGGRSSPAEGAVSIIPDSCSLDFGE